MPITEADIEKIAQLAHLDITDEERKMFAPQISEIVTYVEQLNAVDTSAVEPALGGLTPEGERTESSRLMNCSLRWDRSSRSTRRPIPPRDTFACRRYWLKSRQIECPRTQSALDLQNSIARGDTTARALCKLRSMPQRN